MADRSRSPPPLGYEPGSIACPGSCGEHIWAVAFALPYVVIFLAFVLYPIVYGLWMGSDPALYRQLFDDPRYLTAVINTLLYVGIGVNVKMVDPGVDAVSIMRSTP